MKHFAGWLRLLRSGQVPLEGEELLGRENTLAERVYLGLRTRSGLAVAGSDRAAAETWARSGWAEIDGDVVRLNAEGWLRLDSLASGLTGS